MKFIKLILCNIFILLTLQHSECQWFQQNANTTSNLYSVWTDDGGFGALACGSLGKIFKTINGGTNWINTYTSVSNATVWHSINNHFVLAVCGGDPNQGLIMKSTDFGLTWINQQTNTLYTINSIYFISSLEGWACGDHGTILKTTNGGLNWYVINGVPLFCDYFSIFLLIQAQVLLQVHIR
jgi:photosystem II stability/assembly factor-like uncharacterized protein